MIIRFFCFCFVVFANIVTLAGGHLYTWGRGFHGASDSYIPHCIPADLSFNQVALGWNHALVLTSMRLSLSLSHIYI